MKLLTKLTSAKVILQKSNWKRRLFAMKKNLTKAFART